MIRRFGAIRSSRTLLMSIGSIALTSSAITFASSGDVGASQASLCQRVTTSEVSNALGVKVTAVTSDINGSVTVCWYKVGKLAHAAYVRTQTSVNLAGFNADRKLSKTYGENPVTDGNFKPYAAFSTSIGSVSYGYTYAVTLLKKSTQLDVGTSVASLAKVEFLAKKVLPVL